jgi:hypothetical protein
VHLTRPCVAAALASTLLPLVIFLSASASAETTLSGVYNANGKPAALSRVTAQTSDTESGQPATVLVFTTKDQGGDPKAAFDALFAKFGDALVVKIFPDGKVLSVDLVDSNLDAPGGSITVCSMS